MKKTIKKIFFGKKAFQPLFRRLFDISMEGMNIGTGGRPQSENGEFFTARYVLSQQKKLPVLPIVFDAGAQGGDYIKMILDFTKGESKIYAFEPCQKDYEPLQKTYGQQATIIQSALGNTDGDAMLYGRKDGRGLCSLYKPNEEFSENEKIKIQTIDNFCASHSISYITLLKLDVEGNELDCLKGAKRLLPNIAFIQFEFSSSSRDSRTYFRDIFNFLSDYKIYRILKNGFFEIKNPEKITELLFTTNYLAVKNKPSLKNE
jgi:FkbM family methyltransferase